MKLPKINSTVVLLISCILVIFLFLNLFLNMHPVLDILKYIENAKYYWTVPMVILFLWGLWLFDKNMRKKIVNERVETYNATIRTLQHILHNSSSKMQLLILDMKDEGVREDIVNRAEKNIDELKAVTEALAAVDPKNLELNQLNRNLSIIKMDD